MLYTCFSTSFTGDRASQSNPELVDMATLASLLALENLSPPPSEVGITGATKLIQSFHGFLGVQIPVLTFA